MAPPLPAASQPSNMTISGTRAWYISISSLFRRSCCAFRRRLYSSGSSDSVWSTPSSDGSFDTMRKRLARGAWACCSAACAAAACSMVACTSALRPSMGASSRLPALLAWAFAAAAATAGSGAAASARESASTSVSAMAMLARRLSSPLIRCHGAYEKSLPSSRLSYRRYASSYSPMVAIFPSLTRQAVAGSSRRRVRRLRCASFVTWTKNFTTT